MPAPGSLSPDGEVAFCAEDLRQEELLLLRGALQQRRPHRLQGDQRIRHLGAGRLVDEDLLFHRAEPAPAELLRPADTEPAVPAQPAADFHVRLAEGIGLDGAPFGRRDQGGEVLAEFVAELALLLGVVNEHECPS